MSQEPGGHGVKRRGIDAGLKHRIIETNAQMVAEGHGTRGKDGHMRCSRILASRFGLPQTVIVRILQEYEAGERHLERLDSQ